MAVYIVRWSPRAGQVESSTFYTPHHAVQFEAALRGNGCDVFTDHQA